MSGVIRTGKECLPVTSTQGVTVYATGLYDGDPYVSLMVKMPNGDTFLLGVNSLVRFVDDESETGRLIIEAGYSLPWDEDLNAPQTADQQSDD